MDSMQLDHLLLFENKTDYLKELEKGKRVLNIFSQFLLLQFY